MGPAATTIAHRPRGDRGPILPVALRMQAESEKRQVEEVPAYSDPIGKRRLEVGRKLASEKASGKAILSRRSHRMNTPTPRRE